MLSILILIKGTKKKKKKKKRDKMRAATGTDEKSMFVGARCGCFYSISTYCDDDRSAGCGASV